MREPLANIIAQTKNAQQSRQTSRPVIDPHYATVSDDSGKFYYNLIKKVSQIHSCILILYFLDEMYAAIDEQDKVYTSGSETYAQIQPMAAEVNRSSLNEPSNLASTSRAEEPYAPAPQPPSVDSLRHVAHAHSRQGNKFP